jgi:RNA polymerase-interacting CarD/CdnL/TRCF family regulator
MFTAGDTIVHQRYGAGTVIGMRTMQRQGEQRSYLCIQMLEKSGTLMIPEDQLETHLLRPALTDTDLIKEVLFMQPEELTDNHRFRQVEIEKKLSNHDPRLIVQVLRDLCWRQQSTSLTSTDKRLQRSALTSLLKELVMNPAYTLAKAEQKLDSLIAQAMLYHQQAIKTG